MHHQEVREALLQVAEELPALGDRAHDGPEVVVEQHDRGDLPRAARAPLAHRDPDVGGLERGHVVHPVAGHGDDLAGRLERPHERELLRRASRAPRRRRLRESGASMLAGDRAPRRPRPSGVSPPSPSSRAMARAVRGGRPVTMSTRMPARGRCRDRVGDALPERILAREEAAKRYSRSGSPPLHSAARELARAHAITLCPAAASSDRARGQRVRASASSPHIPRTTSGAPLVTARSVRLRDSTTAVSRRRSSVNGKIATSGRGRCCRLAARMASSSGSPLSAREARRRLEEALGPWAPARVLVGEAQPPFGEGPGLVGADAGDPADVLDGRRRAARAPGAREPVDARPRGRT